MCIVLCVHCDLLVPSTGIHLLLACLLSVLTNGEFCQKEVDCWNFVNCGAVGSSCGQACRKRCDKGEERHIVVSLWHDFQNFCNGKP